jgi:hypothetical protein
MQPDGQVYFDDEEAIPEEDRERYNKAHAAAYALMVYRQKELERMLDAEAR